MSKSIYRESSLVSRWNQPYLCRYHRKMPVFKYDALRDEEDNEEKCCQHSGSRRRNFLLLGIHGILLLANISFFLYTKISIVLRSKAVYCKWTFEDILVSRNKAKKLAPAENVLQYRPYTFDPGYGQNLTVGVRTFYSGPPSKEIDKAWESYERGFRGTSS